MDRKKTLVNFLSDKKYPPLNVEEIMLMLDIPFDDREELTALLSELADGGKIVKTAKKKYASPEKVGCAVGIFSSSERGFGFLLRDGGDIFIPPDKTASAMNGDTVLVKIEKSRKDSRLCEGAVTKIISRANNVIVGTFHNERSFGFLVPDDKKCNFDIFIPKSRFRKAKDGQKVVVKITKWPKNGKKPEGSITEILGYPTEKGVDILSVIKRYNLKTSFGSEVLRLCDAIPNSPSEADTAGREDFRKMKIITVDGEDSRDFDDAVCVTESNGIYTLGVHIADVSHYVTEGSPLDKEAFERATSVYFPDRVVPMLPEKLSNGICSLNPHEDRLTLSVIMEINENGEIINHRITESVICSCERMIYDDVTKILDGDKALGKKYKHIYNELKLMERLAAALKKRRMSEGSIDFNFPETKIKLDENGKTADVYKYESGTANRIIEEFMLAANKTVAEEFFWADIPFVYRVHEKPTDEKTASLADFVSNFGYKLGGGQNPHPSQYSRLLEKIAGKPEEMLISRLMLRSLMKAKYSDFCDGHFGLAFKYYCHFTSPIRRYPDLAVHRIIKEFLNGGISEKRYARLKKFTSETAVHSSEAELNAMDAEREAEDIKKAEYMQSRIGDDFTAIISSVTGFGFFAELENGIEGLVRLSDLKDDYYIYDDASLTLTGERSGKKYRIGDKIKITVAAANPDSRQIDFYPA